MARVSRLLLLGVIWATRCSLTAPTTPGTTEEPSPAPTTTITPTIYRYPPRLNMTMCRKDVQTHNFNCDYRLPNFSVHNSRNIGVFPTLKEGRDFFYSHPLRLFRSLVIDRGNSELSSDTILSAVVQFEDADGDGLADFSAGDYLYFYDTSLLQGSYFSGSGRLRVKGRAPFYEYEESLRVIGYRGYDSFMRGLTSGGNQLLRNISITVFDGNGLESDKLYREFQVVGAKRMYTENTAGKITCVSEVCGRNGIYELNQR